MRKLPGAIVAVVLSCGPFALLGRAQTHRKAPETAASLAEKGVRFAQQGACEQALPLLAKALPHLSNKNLLYAAAMARGKCGMALNRMEDAVEALVLLNREFPDDPRVLYDTTHSFSELSVQAARKLISTKPDSAQAMELQAESLESHDQTKKAIEMYRKILNEHPDTPGVHYRIGRALMIHGTPTAADKAEAKKEFEAELKIVPGSASTEFMLGDLAWEAQDIPGAIEHFSRATKDDVGFLEAFLGLGVALNAAGKYAEAIPPLEKYTKGVPNNPAGHYQLAIAYARTGKKQEAQHQMELQRAAEQKYQKAPYRPKASGS